MPSISLQEKLIRGVIRGIGALPAPVQRVLAGRPIEIDGQRLYTEVQVALRLLNAIPGSSFEELELPAARDQIDAEARVFGTSLPLGLVEDITIPGTGATIPARVYRADCSVTPDGVVAYYHGGGWVVGGLGSADSVCRFIAARSNLVVVSVDYRLAPEHKFPAGLTDAVDAFRWVRDHVDVWGAPKRVAVAGDSAGGNFAAVISQLTRDDEAGGPDFQLLFFPVTDLSRRSRSYELFPAGFFLTAKQMEWYTNHYLSERSEASDFRVSPLLADDLTGLPPAHVGLSGFDVLRDEGLAYAQRLREAGVPVTVQLETGHIHAWVNATGVGKTSSAALAKATEALVAGLRV